MALAHGTSNQNRLPLVWRRRLRLALLVACLLAGLALAAMARYREDDTYRYWAVGYQALAPLIEPTQAWSHRWVLTIGKLDSLWEAEADNMRLRRELTRARLELDLLGEQLGRLERLSGMGTWSAPPGLQFLPADVTGVLTGDDGMLLVINRGRADGIRLRDPVVALDGLVGIVRATSEFSSQVQAITDSMSVVGAATIDTRARGAIYGRGRNQPLEFLPENEAVQFELGSSLISSGFDNSSFPKGLTIGTITDRDFNLYGIPVGLVRSAVQFETLEEVLVILPEARMRGLDLPSTTTLGLFTISMPNTFFEDQPASPTLALGDEGSSPALALLDGSSSPPLALLDGATSPMLAADDATTTTTEAAR